jgi:hypothetical protein
MRYLSEFLTGKVIKGGGQPRVKFIRQDVATDKTLDDPATDISPVKPEGDLPPATDEPRPAAEPNDAGDDDARPRFGDPTDREPRTPGAVDPAEREKERRQRPRPAPGRPTG